MKILLDVQENKAAFFLEMLKNLKFIKKATPLSDLKAETVECIRQSVLEMKQVRRGELTPQSVEELINEL